MLFTMKQENEIISHILSRFKKEILTKIIYMWHVHKTEKFWYPIIDVILKCGKELMKTVLVTLSGKVLF